MSSVFDKFVCPIIKFLIFALAKLLFDILVLTATGWEYTNFIFFEAFFASCCLFFKYIKQSKRQQEEVVLNTQFNSSFFKKIIKSYCYFYFYLIEIYYLSLKTQIKNSFL